MKYAGKIGLAGLALAGSIFLASPSRADFSENYSTDNSCFVEKENLWTFGKEDLPENDFKKMVSDAFSDGEFGYDDAQKIFSNFSRTQGEEIDILKREVDLATLYIQETREQIRDYTEEIRKIDENVEKISERVYPSVNAFVSEKRREIETQVLNHYPNLLGNGPEKITYDADSELTNELWDIEGKTIDDFRNFFDFYDIEQEESVSINNDVKGLLTWYNYLKRMESAKYGELRNDKRLFQEQERLKDIVLKLETRVETAGQIKEEYLRQFNSGKFQCDGEIVQYLDVKNLEKKLVDVKDLRKYWTITLLDQKDFQTAGYLDDANKEFLDKQDGAIDSLRSCLLIKYTTDVMGTLRDFKFEEIESPRKLKVPLGPGTFFGLLLPVARNLGITYYLTRKRLRGTRMGGSALSGFCNGLFGVTLLDGLNPWVYPVRMLATPIIIQPILKATKFYDKHDGENFIFED